MNKEFCIQDNEENNSTIFWAIKLTNNVFSGFLIYDTDGINGAI